jgi:hypothetical protein
MTRSTPRLAAIAAAAIALAFAALLAGHSSAAGPAASGAKTDCGTYDSTSTFDRGQVFAIRGVKCRKARKVAKKYDHKGTAPGPWKCALAHGGGKALFSCGYGESRGNIRDWPHALIAKGVNRSSDDPPAPAPPSPPSPPSPPDPYPY